MKETPNIITVKDLLYLEDMMNWNFTMCKKIDSLIDCIEDENTSELLCKIRKMHFKHYKELLNTLE